MCYHYFLLLNIPTVRCFCSFWPQLTPSTTRSTSSSTLSVWSLSSCPNCHSFIGSGCSGSINIDLKLFFKLGFGNVKNNVRLSYEAWDLKVFLKEKQQLCFKIETNLYFFGQIFVLNKLGIWDLYILCDLQ